MAPYGSRMATREHHELKNSGNSLFRGEPGHLDQYPYTDSWLGLAQDPPTSTRFCIQKGKGKILMAQKLTDDKKGNSTGFGWVDLTPPPYWIVMLLPQCSIRIGGRLNAQSRAR